MKSSLDLDGFDVFDGLDDLYEQIYRVLYQNPDKKINMFSFSQFLHIGLTEDSMCDNIPPDETIDLSIVAIPKSQRSFFP